MWRPSRSSSPTTSGRARYRVAPGQFNMLYLPGVGEVPISVSGGPDEGPGIGHTIRFAGRVTRRDGKLAAGLDDRAARPLRQ